MTMSPTVNAHRDQPAPAARTKVPTVAMIGSRGFPGQPGGVERVLEALCPRLVQSGGADVTVYCANWLEHDSDTFDGVHLRRVNGLRSKYGDTFSRSLLATMKELIGGAEIIHYHSIGSAPLAILPRIFGKKVVVTVHALDWQRSKWNRFATAFLRFGEWASVKLPHRTTVVGADMKDYLEGAYDCEVDFIPNGADRKTRVDAVTLEDRGLTPGNFLLFVGRLVPEKGVHLLIEAFKALPAELGLELALTGPVWYETEYQKELETLIDGDERIHFVGQADDELLAELYSNCRCFVLPSDVEGMSLSLLDAMAFGCPIVTSSIPPNTSLVGDAAAVFEAGNVDDLALQLAAVVTDEARAAELRVLAEQRSRRFEWDVVATEWSRLYGELVGIPPS